jgi:[ribosomal protein S5]-alanine N-acetyltransferase
MLKTSFFHTYPDIETARLVLRRLKMSDTEAIHAIRSNTEVNTYLDRPFSISTDEAASFIQKIENLVASNEGLYWAITLKDNGALIGTICYWNIDAEKDAAEIGYELLPHFQGKGIMTEALKSVIKLGFDFLKLKNITAFPQKNNLKSYKLLKKCHFTRDFEHEKLENDDLYAAYILTDSINFK